MNKSENELLDEYLGLPDRLEALVAGLEENDLDLRLENAWSIREYVCHLVEGELLWQINLRMIIGLNGEKFPFSWYPQHSQVEWAEYWAYGSRSLNILLEQYLADTRFLVDTLKNLPDVWKHYGCITWPGYHEEFRYSVRDIIEMHINHLDEHARDISAIRANHGR